MKKFLFIFVFFILIAFVAVLFMYLKDEQVALPEEPMEFSGFVFSISDDRILVADGLARGIKEYTGALEELHGNAIWFAVKDKTKIKDINNNKLSYSDIKINDGVKIYSTLPLLLSYPAQGKADKIILTGETFTHESAEFEEIGNIAINNPGFEEDVWYLIYEAPGEPALFEKLLFDENSVCVYEEEEQQCDQENFTQGDRVRVIGEKVGDTVKVHQLVFEE